MKIVVEKAGQGRSGRTVIDPGACKGYSPPDTPIAGMAEIRERRRQATDASLPVNGDGSCLKTKMGQHLSPFRFTR